MAQDNQYVNLKSVQIGLENFFLYKLQFIFRGLQQTY